MTRSPIAVSTETTIDQVLETLVTQGVPSVYVTTGDNRLVGIVTDYEVLKHQVLGGDRTQTAETLMNRGVPTARPDDSATAVCPSSATEGWRRMAVIDAEGHLVGNLARRDVMRMMLAVERMASETREAVADTPRPAVRESYLPPAARKWGARRLRLLAPPRRLTSLDQRVRIAPRSAQVPVRLAIPVCSSRQSASLRPHCGASHQDGPLAGKPGAFCGLRKDPS